MILDKAGPGPQNNENAWQTRTHRDACNDIMPSHDRNQKPETDVKSYKIRKDALAPLVRRHWLSSRYSFEGRFTGADQWCCTAF